MKNNQEVSNKRSVEILATYIYGAILADAESFGLDIDPSILKMIADNTSLYYCTLNEYKMDVVYKQVKKRIINIEKVKGEPHRWVEKLVIRSFSWIGFEHSILWRGIYLSDFSNYSVDEVFKNRVFDYIKKILNKKNMVLNQSRLTDDDLTALTYEITYSYLPTVFKYYVGRDGNNKPMFSSIIDVISDKPLEDILLGCIDWGRSKKGSGYWNHLHTEIINEIENGDILSETESIPANIKQANLTIPEIIRLTESEEDTLSNKFIAMSSIKNPDNFDKWKAIKEQLINNNDICGVISYCISEGAFSIYDKFYWELVIDRISYDIDIEPYTTIIGEFNEPDDIMSDLIIINKPTLDNPEYTKIYQEIYNIINEYYGEDYAAQYADLLTPFWHIPDIALELYDHVCIKDALNAINQIIINYINDVGLINVGKNPNIRPIQVISTEDAGFISKDHKYRNLILIVIEHFIETYKNEDGIISYKKAEELKGRIVEFLSFVSNNYIDGLPDWIARTILNPDIYNDGIDRALNMLNDLRNIN